jgi:hypothetical protein
MTTTDESLGLRWRIRQDLLIKQVEALGQRRRLDFRADLARGRFWWQDADGRPVIVASTRLLLTYAASNRSALCGWANKSIPEAATVPPVEGLQERIADCTEEDAWEHAMRVAEAVGAHFIYRAPNAQVTSFLGLWDVRPAVEGDEPFVAGPPWPYVRQVLAALSTHLKQRETLSEKIVYKQIDAVFRSYGRTLVDDQLRRGTSCEAALRGMGEKLIAAAEATPEVKAKVLAELEADVARCEPS